MTTTMKRNTLYKRKRNKTTRRRTTKKHRKTHSKKYKLRGGNFGGHCPDPFNYSIYNSNMLKIFPYLPLANSGKG
jgi:hypothetical protein